ncbi:MAG: DUF4149 domain-containing protein [Pyrinomonadaceae bacterium]
MNAELEKERMRALELPKSVRAVEAIRQSAKTSGAAVKFVAEARYLILALWLGASLFLSFVVAPGAFQVTPSREVAGALVGYGLNFLNTSGLLIGSLLLTTLWWQRSVGRWFRAEMCALLVLSISAGANEWVIAARLREIRQGAGGAIEQLAASDPARVMFGRWHAASMLMLIVCMLAALAALVAMLRRRN